MPASEIDPTQNAQDNPLAAGLARITGKKTPLSQSTGTSTGVIGYDPTQTFRPTGDVINLSSAPGTGATTAESWSHDIALENLKQSQLEFEYQQQQADLAAAQKAQEFALTQQQFGLTQAEAARQAALAPAQLQAAQLANKAAAQQMSLAKQDAANKQMATDLASFEKTGVRSPTLNAYLGNAATSSLQYLRPLSAQESQNANQWAARGYSPQQAYNQAANSYYDPKIQMAAAGYNPQTGRFYEGIADMNKANQMNQDAYYSSIGVNPASIASSFQSAIGGRASQPGFNAIPTWARMPGVA